MVSQEARPSPPVGTNLRLYDSLRREVAPFEAPDGRVRLYVCGVTPYDTTHLGHAFTYLVFDVLIRSLQRHGLRVTYVQNVTDVDDDLLERARRDRRDWEDLATENVALFRRDLEALEVLMPDFYPWASHEVPAMIQIIEPLLERGLAYRAGGNVYFRVACFPTYGQLSGLDRREMLEVSRKRGADPDDPRKEDPLDFILWQASAPDEPSWETPWGPGRPGWHIECSAMSYRYLGPQLEVHGGGGDLIFPHHESEIAQSESYSGRQPFARFWVHTSMLRYQGEKMSKSLGNMVFVRQLREHYSPDAIRLCLLAHHYRTEFDFQDDECEQAGELAERLAGAWREQGSADDDPTSARIAERGLAALDDDLDTPGAIAALRELLALPASRGRREALGRLGETLGLTFDV
jgi:L-cysteine:1D-myo-inositol 2-amino-2-deoxy-alpha-D-glucopyranoside ligase